jgi:hypothetical protein
MPEWGMSALPANIAAIQWNNRLKSLLLALVFLLGILIFAVSLVLMIGVPVMLFSKDPNFRPEVFFDNPRIQWHVFKFFTKVLLFCLGAAAFFIWKHISHVGKVMSARPLKLPSSDPFYRALENLCISRGLRVPDLYVFHPYALRKDMVTAAVMQGTGGSWALILTEGALQLAPALREALLAQAVQRVHSKDTFFLTRFCFLGYFPFHIMNGTNKIGRIMFKLPLGAADLLMKPLRPRVLDLRLARLDSGSLELTKEAGPMAALLAKLPTHKEVEAWFHEPYLPLFIARSDSAYRQDLLAG